MTAISYYITYLWYYIWYKLWYDIWYHWPLFNPPGSRLGHWQPSLRQLPRCDASSSLRPPGACSRWDSPYSLSLGDRHHAGAAPAVAPHPDVHHVEPAAVAPVPLRVGGGVSESKTQIVLEAVWNRGVTVAANEARKVLSWGPSPSSHMSMTSISPCSTALIRR